MTRLGIFSRLILALVACVGVSGCLPSSQSAADEQKDELVDTIRWVRLAKDVLSAEGVKGDAELSMHPTVKPLSMVADAILDCSKRGGIVLDAFAGSGTTLIAAERTGRRGYGVELDPYYCDTIVRRFVDAHDLKASPETKFVRPALSDAHVLSALLSEAVGGLTRSSQARPLASSRSPHAKNAACVKSI